MDWTQALTIIVSVFGLFLVAVPYLISKMDANQKENNAKFESMNARFNSLENRQTAMEVEIKNITQRLSNIENCVMPRKVFHFQDSHKPDHEEPKEN